MFILSPNSPEVALKKFYLQLLIAHLLFALGAFIFIF